MDCLPPEPLVDLNLYPLDRPGSSAYRVAVKEAEEQLTSIGAAELEGFVSPTGVLALVAEGEQLAHRAHLSSGQGTAYLEVPDFALPEGHPRLTWGEYSLGAVAYDLIPYTSPLRQLYEWRPMTDLSPPSWAGAPSIPMPIPSERSILPSCATVISCNGISTKPTSSFRLPSRAR